MITALKTVNAGQSLSIGPAKLAAAWKDDARCVQVNGGTAKLANVTVAGGYGVHVDRCDLLEWIGGGNSGKTKKYSLFAGNVLVGRAKRVYLKDLVLPWPSEYEAQIRFMGCDEVVIDNCIIGDATKQPPHTKEIFQGRHIRKLAVVNSKIIGSLVLGTLGPGEASPASLDIYHRDAKQFRLAANFENCEILGDVRITGQSDARFSKCRFTGPDPRGRSGSTCINLKSFSTAYGTLKPTCVAESCLWTGWKVKAASGVVIR